MNGRSKKEHLRFDWAGSEREPDSESVGHRAKVIDKNYAFSYRIDGEMK